MSRAELPRVFGLCWLPSLLMDPQPAGGLFSDLY